MNRLVCCLTACTAILLASSAHAQNNWPSTRIDDHITIQMPYQGNLEEDENFKGAQRFWTTTSDNEFQVFRVDLRYDPKFNPNLIPTPSGLSKAYGRAAKRYNRKIIKGELLSEGEIVFAGNLAHAALYRGFDDFHQRPINIETVWIYHNQAMYLLTCSYTVPEDISAVEDKKRFFSSFRIDYSPVPNEI